MKDKGLETYTDLIVHHMVKVREMLNKINEEKTAIYWSDEATFDYTYRKNDIL